MRATRHNYYLAIAAGMMIVLLVACEIKATPTLTPPNHEATGTPTKQVTPAATLTSTMEPTLAYWATAQQATFSAESTQVVETKQAISLLSERYSQMCGYQLEGVSTSPDGSWIATDCRFDGDFFRVFQTQGDQVWDIPYAAVMKYYPEFIGDVRALHWSDDGKALYFASSSCCADTDAFTNGDSLYRLDLQTGSWTVVTEGTFSYYSFSPDGTHLIYLVNNQAYANDSLRLHLFDLDTGNEEFIEVDGFEHSWIVWKDNSQKIALLAKNGSIYDDNMRFSLVIVNLLNKHQKSIILNSEHGLDVTNWSHDDILTIRESSVMKHHDYYVNVFDVRFYDLKSNLFLTPTLTP